MAADQYNPYGFSGNDIPDQYGNGGFAGNGNGNGGVQPAPQAAPPPGTPPTATPPAGPSRSDIAGAYQTYLGRQPGTQGGDATAENAWEAGDPQWLQTIQNSPEAAAYKAKQAANPVPGASNTSGLTGSGTNDALIAQLMKRANGSLNIDANTDPIIKPQVDNYGATQTRMARGIIDQAAEGGNPYATGALQNTRTQAAETAGQNTANLQSTLTQNELTARRKEIQDALTESGSLLTADQQISLQRELGLLDAGLKQQQITSGNDQFMADLGLRTADRNNYWDAVRNGTIGG